MNKRVLRADILLLLTAGIWGFGFVAQRAGMQHIGPFAFNGIRFILGGLSLLPFIIVKRKAAFSPSLPDAGCPLWKLLPPSLAAGGCLFIAISLQQFGVLFTTVANAGFITSFYVVLTPIFGIFLGKKTGLPTWVGAAFTIIGLYFLVMNANIGAAGYSGSINPGDILVLISAFFWAIHVLLIDHFMQGSAVDPLELSAGQFAVCGAMALASAFIFEPHVAAVMGRIDPALLSAGLFSWLPFPALIAGLREGTMFLSLEIIIPVLYGSLVSVGIAYTLQVIAQRDAPPAHAAIILCFEGCFAALGGVLLFSEKIGNWTLLGFTLMLLGMLITQWEVILKHKRENENV